jgi:ppGpp synthetase/RelA/SpoT-type nucleotidyltranferase
MSLEATYRRRFDEVLGRLSGAIEAQLHDYLLGEDHIDRITARAKSIDRFMGKAAKMENGKPKYTEPLAQIQDQVGARIITFYLSDVRRISEVVRRYYRPVESRTVVPDSEWEFSYFGEHFVLLVPSDLIEPETDRTLVPDFFELQIKTLFQHAWSEAEHDLGYKPGAIPLTADQNRRLAFTAAQAWGADRIFDELGHERGAFGSKE